MGVDVDVCVGVRAGVGVAVGVAVAGGVGIGVGIAVEVGRGVETRIGERDGIGVGKICSAVGSSTVGVPAGFGDSGFAVGIGVGVDVDAPSSTEPGSDQAPTFSPLVNVVCNRVVPCSLMTGPSNFPRTILPV